MVEGENADLLVRAAQVSIRRADYWLVEVVCIPATSAVAESFNPPGGLLVG